jgi:hypothetical protein
MQRGFGLHQQAQLGQRRFAAAGKEDLLLACGEEDGKVIHDAPCILFDVTSYIGNIPDNWLVAGADKNMCSLWL